MKTNKSGVVPNQAYWGFCKTPEDFALMNFCLLYSRQIVVYKILGVTLGKTKTVPPTAVDIPTGAHREMGFFLLSD